VGRLCGEVLIRLCACVDSFLFWVSAIYVVMDGCYVLIHASLGPRSCCRMIFLAGFSCAQLTLMLHAELLACTLPRSEILPFFHTCGLLPIR